MTRKLKKIHVALFSTFVFLIHLPFVFAKSIPHPAPHNSVAKVGAVKKPDASGTKFTMVYDSLRLMSLGLTEGAFTNALKGFSALVEKGRLANEKIISIVDFSLPSSQKRLFVIDLEHCKLLYNTYVSHGRNSGMLYAKQFSNAPESYKSSLGFYVTEDTYSGKHGYSLKLSGEERGINDNALARAIVMHSADYADESVVKSQGRLGRSLGCPALPPSIYKPVIETIKNGSCLFLYSPDAKYLSSSKLLQTS